MDLIIKEGTHIDRWKSILHLIIINFKRIYIYMKYNNQLVLGSIKSVNGNEYSIVQIKNYGIGPLFGCKKYVFAPINKKLKKLFAIEWRDGHIDRLKYLI